MAEGETLWHGVTSCGDCPLLNVPEGDDVRAECCHPANESDVRPKPHAARPPRDCPLRTTPLLLKLHGGGE